MYSTNCTPNFRNSSVLTQSSLKEFNSSGKISSQKNTPSPSLKLLQRFQRLLFGKIFSSNQDSVETAETLLMKYLDCFSSHITTTLNTAYEISLLNSRNFLYVLQILKNDIVGKLKYVLSFN